MILAFLQSEGFEVRWADNGLEGVDLILKEQPDLVVIDIMMLGIDNETASRSSHGR
ncbi:MAG TPA: response regulator [Leucothrix sp.]|nr:response regulator [Leucothrix sp.]